MTRFNNYAKELDQAVKAYFRKYRDAEKKLQRVNDMIKETNADLREFQRTGNTEKEWLAKSRLAALQVDRKKAENEFSNVKKGNFEAHKQIKEVRERLEAECNAAFALDPDALDPAFFALLNSGAMRISDFEHIWQKEEEAGNVTMLRLVADAAGHAAEAAHNKGDRESARRLNALSNKAHSYTTNGVLERFDELVTVSKYVIGDPQSLQSDRAFPNPAFFDRWDDLTSEFVESF